MNFKKKVLLLNALMAAQPMIQKGEKPKPAGDDYEAPKPVKGKKGTAK